jgi:hypothetical protein
MSESPRAARVVGARVAWAVLGVAAGVACVVVGSPWLLLAWLVPDLGVLAGGWRVVDGHGRLTRSAAIGYNLTHALPGPGVLALLAALTATATTWAVVALWLCHIGVDRALGYSLKPVPAAHA